MHSKIINYFTIHINYKIYSTIFLSLFILLIYDENLLTIEAGCLLPNGLRMCCEGKQTKCFRFIDAQQTISPKNSYLIYKSNLVKYDNNNNNNNNNLSQKRCFCDESCVATNDCCPDYQSVCQSSTVNCKVGEWGPWTSCSETCGNGVSTRYRKIIIYPKGNGANCPKLNETKICNTGNHCAPKRVGRSGALLLPYVYDMKGEVAHLLPVRGDVLHLTRRYDMRWDVRRKLYLGRLIQMNKTEEPEPDPYCAVYEITQVNKACQTHNLLWQFTSSQKHINPFTYYSRNLNRYHRSSNGQAISFSRYQPYMNSQHSNSYLDSNIFNKNNNWGNNIDSNSETWITHASLLSPGQQICVTCYPAYMREDLGYRCTGSGLPNVETRWRALRTSDCQGRFRLVSVPQRLCTCGRGVASFVFV